MRADHTTHSRVQHPTNTAINPPKVLLLICLLDGVAYVLMRPHNSVGGYRIYPTAPDFAEACDRAVAIRGKFREGMDCLNTERQLTARQQAQVDQLVPTCEQANNHRRLMNASNRLWQLALENQRDMVRYEDYGQFTTEQLGELLNDCAKCWQAFKRQLDKLA